MAKFEKGKSGNPAGRPKSGTAFSDILREKADPAKMADALLALAYSGDIAAIKAVYDRLEGRPRESIELKNSTEEEHYPTYAERVKDLEELKAREKELGIILNV